MTTAMVDPIHVTTQQENSIGVSTEVFWIMMFRRTTHPPYTSLCDVTTQRIRIDKLKHMTAELKSCAYIHFLHMLIQREDLENISCSVYVTVYCCTVDSECTNTNIKKLCYTQINYQFDY
jgi:hypothetical protein